jgi:hypothetical protein
MDDLTSTLPLTAELDRRISEDPLTALAAITALRRAVAERERDAVFRALESHSWREVGEALGVTKQAAFQRFGVEWAELTRARSPKDWKRTVEDRLTR